MNDTNETKPELPIALRPSLTRSLLALGVLALFFFGWQACSSMAAQQRYLEVQEEESEHNDRMRERAVKQLSDELKAGQGAIIDAIRATPSGTWVELENGTAHCEWLAAESLDVWAARALVAADLADQMNGRTPR